MFWEFFWDFIIGFERVGNFFSVRYEFVECDGGSICVVVCIFIIRFCMIFVLSIIVICFVLGFFLGKWFRGWCKWWVWFRCFVLWVFWCGISSWLRRVIMFFIVVMFFYVLFFVGVRFFDGLVYVFVDFDYSFGGCMWKEGFCRLYFCCLLFVILYLFFFKFMV